jgi:hypothetical protein
MKRLLLVVAGFSAGLGLVACGGDGGDSTVTTATTAVAKVPALKAAWTAQPGALWSPAPASTSAWAWTTDDALVVPEKQALASYGAADGKQRWRTALPKAVCAISDAPNADGVGAVLLAGGTSVNDQACGTVVAVDVNTGKLLWSKSLKGESSYGMTDVQVGPDAVVVTNPCDRALAFSAADGKALAALPKQDSQGCRHSYASDGTTIVDGDDVREGGEAFVGYDATSGKQRWVAPVKADANNRRANPTVERVVSSDPLVIDASTNGHRFLQTVDPDAGTVTPFGREADDSYPPVLTQTVGDDLVVQYGQSPVLFAYDPKTGDEASHAVLDNGSAFGVRDGRVIAASTGGATLDKAGLAVTATDPSNGDQQVLAGGSLDGVAATFGRGTGYDLALVGSTMILRTTDRLAAYQLPADGPALSSVTPPQRLAQGDLTPAQAADLCTALTPDTKRAFGFADPDRAAPANCDWVEPVADDGIRQLRVSASAAVAGQGKSADENAQAAFTRLTKPDTLNGFAQLTPVPWVGDQGAQGSNTKRTRVTRVVARVGNVVLLLDAIGSDMAPRKREMAVLERATRLAAIDLAAEVKRRG